MFAAGTTGTPPVRLRRCKRLADMLTAKKKNPEGLKVNSNALEKIASGKNHHSRTQSDK
jgi:hypothetical protein